MHSLRCCDCYSGWSGSFIGRPLHCFGTRSATLLGFHLAGCKSAEMRQYLNSNFDSWAWREIPGFAEERSCYLCAGRREHHSCLTAGGIARKSTAELDDYFGRSTIILEPTCCYTDWELRSFQLCSARREPACQDCLLSVALNCCCCWIEVQRSMLDLWAHNLSFWDLVGHHLAVRAWWCSYRRFYFTWSGKANCH